MVEKSKEEIAEAITAGEITGICLDTSIFENHHLNLEKGLLYRLKQFKTGTNKVYLPLIIKNELLAHLTKKAEDAQKEHSKALKGVISTWNLDAIQADVSKSLYAEETPESVSQKRLDNFIAAVDAQIVDTSSVSPDSVFELYFRGAAPFSKKETKKHEFPDAFSLLAIDKFAQEKNTKLLVVSGDKGWQEFCSSAEKLVWVENLVTGLSCFQDESANYACSLIDEEFLKGNADEWKADIMKAVDDQLWDNEFYVEAITEFDYEHDLEEVVLVKLEFQPLEGTETYFQPVELDEGKLATEVACKLYLEITTSISFKIWDNIDKERVELDTQWYKTKAEVTVKAMIFFEIGEFNLHLPANTSISDIEIDKETIFVDLGQIDPELE